MNSWAQHIRANDLAKKNVHTMVDRIGVSQEHTNVECSSREWVQVFVGSVYGV